MILGIDTGGPNWGDAGYFYLERGNNVIGVEEWVCSSPPAEGLNDTKFIRDNIFELEDKSKESFTPNPTITNMFKDRQRLVSGGWVDEELDSSWAIKVAEHLAGLHNDMVREILVSKKQVVAGINRHMVFDALSSDNQTYRHTTIAWVMLNGTINVSKHERLFWQELN